MAELNANLLNRIATPVDNYNNMVQGQQAVEMNNFNMENQKKAAKTAEASARLERIAGVLQTAKGDPVKWKQATEYLRTQGIEFDPGEDDMNNADFLIGSTMSAAEQIKNGIEAEKLDLGRFNADTLRMNAETGRTKATAPGADAKAPSGYRYTEDGTGLEPIKGGPADPDKKVPVKSLRPTTDQNNAAGFYDRLVEAEAVLSDPAVVEAATDYVGKQKASAPFGLGNYLATPEYQKFDQAQRNFINAVLRKESGAAIAESEFQNAAQQYFPQPFDSPEKIAQKAQNRATVVRAMKRTAASALTQGQQQEPPQDMSQAEPGEIPSKAVSELLADPSGAAEFDEIFGEGAAAQILEQQ